MKLLKLINEITVKVILYIMKSLGFDIYSMRIDVFILNFVKISSILVELFKTNKCSKLINIVMLYCVIFYKL